MNIYHDDAPAMGAQVGALVGHFLRQLRRYRPGQPLANVVGKRLGFIPGS